MSQAKVIKGEVNAIEDYSTDLASPSIAFTSPLITFFKVMFSFRVELLSDITKVSQSSGNELNRISAGI
jgi:hypothetical protein